MAFTGNFTCNSFKSGLLSGSFDFASDTFKIALYTNDAALNSDTSAYTLDGEVSASGYTAGGEALTVTTGITGGISFVSFGDTSWSAAMTARGALIYNDTAAGDPSVVVLDFGADKTSTNGDFQVIFPTADASNAIIRIA